MSLIIYNVGQAKLQVRILFDGEEPLKDDIDIIEVPLVTLHRKAYLVNTLRKQYPDITKALIGEHRSPYSK